MRLFEILRAMAHPMHLASLDGLMDGWPTDRVGNRRRPLVA